MAALGPGSHNHLFSCVQAGHKKPDLLSPSTFSDFHIICSHGSVRDTCTDRGLFCAISSRFHVSILFICRFQPLLGAVKEQQDILFEKKLILNHREHILDECCFLLSLFLLRTGCRGHTVAEVLVFNQQSVHSRRRGL